MAAVVEERKESVATAAQPTAAAATSVATKKANPFSEPAKAPVDSIKSRMLKAASDQSHKQYLFTNPHRDTMFKGKNISASVSNAQMVEEKGFLTSS